jgi:hypothetical protein
VLGRLIATDVHGVELDGAPVWPRSGMRYESMFVAPPP